jgi:hypothetical protein
MKFVASIVNRRYLISARDGKRKGKNNIPKINISLRSKVEYE